MKISHKELETCRFSAKSWVASRLSGGSFGRFSYKQALGFAICEFHKANSVKAASAKIDEYVAKSFKDTKKIARLYERLDEYTKWFIGSGIITADANVRLNYPSSGDWHLGGLVSRVDVAATGYRAVIFEIPIPSWKDQLRMPLIQLAIADRYGRPASEVMIGLQNLDGNAIVEATFGSATRSAAGAEFLKIGDQVAKLWP